MKMTRMIAMMTAGLALCANAALTPVRDYKVDGKKVTLASGEKLVDLAKIYPDGFHYGEPGKRWAELEATVTMPADGYQAIYCQNDWFGELSVNGQLVSKADGPLGSWRPVFAKFRKGANEVRYRTRAGAVSWVCGLATDDDSENLPAYADFTRVERPLRRELHSSGFGPTICSQTAVDLADVKAMGFTAARTHDWALINPNERVCDYFHIFPLMHLDAKDPKNYHFAPTDYLLKRTREETGLDVFYRLGTSIEHSGRKVHFNTVIPEDSDKVAEIFAGTVRHYNRGWANGYDWGIKYWEIWNEPEGIENMWCPPEGTEGLSKEAGDAKRAECRAKFVTFFVTCLKRLKGEFGDTVKVGGPALCGCNTLWMTNLLESCRQTGVAPDFLSWHGYTRDPMQFVNEAARVRKMCDGYGFTKTELIVNEWHYFGANYNWDEMQRCSDPLVKARIWEGPDSHNGIRSACFTLATLANIQHSQLDQAYYYGCRHTGAWGFKDELQRKYSVFYGLKLFGDILRDYTTLCASHANGTLYTMAVTRADGRKGLLVVDYGGTDFELAVPVVGVKPGAKATAVVLDDKHNLTSHPVTFADGEVTIKKNDFHSAAFFVEFAE